MHNLDFEAAVRSSAFQPLGSLAEFVFRGYSESLEEVLQHAETILEKRLVYSHGTIQVLIAISAAATIIAHPAHRMACV